MKKLAKRKVKVKDPTKFQFVGVQYLDKSHMQVFLYDKDNFEENKKFQNPSKINEYLKNDQKFWFNIHGIHDTELIKQICSQINIHRLVIQDLIDTTHLSRIQEMDDYLFFTLKSHLIDENNEIDIEQISFILGKNYLLTFQEKKGDHFEHIRERLREKVGLVRERSIDYLLFLLLEAMLDNFDLTIKSKISEIETQIKFDSNTEVKPEMMMEIESFKDQFNLLKKSLQPILDSLIKIEKGFTDLIAEDNLKYYMGLKDTCQHLSAEVDFNLLKLESAINMFFSLQNQKMNQIMKTLTIVASIFIPLTFIAGIYGMNFENMPELKWEFGYFLVLLVMFTVLIVLLSFFKIKKWFK